MALIMVAPMGIIVLAVMRNMFESERLNLAAFRLFAAVFIGGPVARTSRAFVGNEGSLKSMIPYHLPGDPCLRGGVNHRSADHRALRQIIETQPGRDRPDERPSPDRY